MAELKTSIQGGVATVLFSNPAKMNAMTFDMWESVPRVFAELDANPGVRLIVCAGDGEKASWFSLELGIEVGGRRVNLLPALLDLPPAVEPLRRQAVLAGYIVQLPRDRGDLDTGEYGSCNDEPFIDSS